LKEPGAFRFHRPREAWIQPRTANCKLAYAAKEHNQLVCWYVNIAVLVRLIAIDLKKTR
jgi:hypothetical protein